MPEIIEEIKRLQGKRNLFCFHGEKGILFPIPFITSADDGNKKERTAYFAIKRYEFKKI